MINRKAIGYITANYSSSYGSVLLKDRPIASVPFLGRYRLIDFPLSNMMNAGIKTVGVVMPGNYRSLIDHVGSGKDWGLDRKKGGLFMVPGNAYGTTKGGMRFLLRDIISNKTLFQRSEKPYVVMMGTNIIFNMDLNTIIEAHENSGAQMTVVYCKATRNVDDETKLEINENGRLTGVSAGVAYGDNASMDCCIVNRETLLEIIDHYQAADYLDLLEALQGDFGNIDVCSYEYKGEVVGIIGRNGSGKSTLLKIISGLFPPTKGSVRVHGRIIPMLELGSGFDPELTGRENVFLNGAILGYSEAFLRERFDEILEFSELGNFIDMPLKTYSSGMMMRLAFSVATIVEPEILIVDEILAVGDEAFQRKSRAKMMELMGGGTTVLFVSHSLGQIREMCNRVIWLDHGKVVMQGEVNTVCNAYNI